MASDCSPHQHLAATARWTAATRARESARPDRLFSDPWAALLAGDEGNIWFERFSTGPGEASGEVQVVRTRFFDDFLLRLTHAEPIRQVVLLAAGMDTRAYRLAWPPGTRLFELDQPGVLSLKTRQLAAEGATPACEHHTIGVDLNYAQDAALGAAGFDPRQRSVWLIEGLLFYLPEPAALQLLDRVTALAGVGSWLGLDVVNQAMLTSESTRAWVESLARAGVPWRFATDEPEQLLAARGWVANVTQPGEEGAHFGRWPYQVAPRSVPGSPRSLLVTAQLPVTR
jgi:methyltransferase (TIGR00027 family)